MSDFHLQKIQTLQNSLREREEYITDLENRLRALWDKYYGDLNHHMDRIKRLEEAGDELVGSADAMEAWRKAKEDKP